MPNTEPTRLREYAVTERAELDRLLDEVLVAHVGLSDDNGGVVVIPTVTACSSMARRGLAGCGAPRRAGQYASR
jgi:hypothetical protein